MTSKELIDIFENHLKICKLNGCKSCYFASESVNKLIELETIRESVKDLINAKNRSEAILANKDLYALVNQEYIES